MPCLRPAAASTYAAIWITDEVLAAAWRRFTHVYNNSHSKRPRIDGGRRHGSNVPGPLESRRRLAKRRMGLASHSPPPNGGGGDFGALFGFGTRGATRQDAERGWKWEAPTSQQAADVTFDRNKWSVWGNGWAGGKPTRNVQDIETWEKFLQVPVEEVLVEDALFKRSEIDEVQLDPVLASSDAFGRLLSDLDRVNTLQTDNLADVITFLQSSADEMEAKNASRLIQWLGRRGHVTNEVIDLVMDVIVSKIRLDTLSMEESAEILRNLAHALRPTAPEFSPTHVVMRALQRSGLLLRVCATTTRLLVEESLNEDELTPVIELWLSCLRLFESKEQLPSFDAVWHGVYEQLAKKYTRPAMLRKHLSAHDPELLAVILLHYWVPHILASSDDPVLYLDDKGDGGASNINHLSTVALGTSERREHRPPIDMRTSDVGATNIGYRTTNRKRGYDTLHLSFSCLMPTDFARVLDSYKTLHGKAPGGEYRHTALVDVVLTLAYHRLPYAAFACDIFSILTYPSSTRTSRDILIAYRRLRNRLDMGVPSVLGIQLIDYFLSTNDLRYALFVFHSTPGIPLSRFHALPIAIAEDSSTVPSSAIWDVLHRTAREDYTPRPALGAAQQPLLLLRSHIDLVHRVAFAFAKQEQLTPRVAFRRVWECYRFLKDRSAPVESLISRALVIAGVIRPLKLGMRVPTEQLRFILSIVEMVEGREVAEQLDRKVLEIWEGAVLPGLLKAQRLGLEESRIERGADRWRAIVWAREINGENRRVHVRHGTEIVDSDTASRYEPFAFNDGDGDISKSLPRAGAVSWDVPTSSEVWGDELTDLEGSANRFDVSQDTAWPDDTLSDAQIRPYLPQEPLIRRGLGYSTSDSGNHANAVTREPSFERRTSHEPAVSQAITATKSFDGIGVTLSGFFSLKKPEALGQKLAANLEGFNGIKEHESDRQSEALAGVKCKSSHVSKRKDRRTKTGSDGSALPYSTVITKLAEKRAAKIRPIRTSEIDLREDRDINTVSIPAVARQMNHRPLVEYTSTPHCRTNDPQGLTELATVGDSAESMQATSAPTSTPPVKGVAKYFPILWQGGPVEFEMAIYLARRSKSLHPKQLPTDSELSFMQSYNAALSRLVDDEKPVKDEILSPVFPFRWGAVMVHDKLANAVKLYIVQRAKAARRGYTERESAFARMCNHANKRITAARKRKSRLRNIEETGLLQTADSSVGSNK